MLKLKAVEQIRAIQLMRGVRWGNLSKLKVVKNDHLRINVSMSALTKCLNNISCLCAYFYVPAFILLRITAKVNEWAKCFKYHFILKHTYLEGKPWSSRIASHSHLFLSTILFWAFSITVPSSSCFYCCVCHCSHLLGFI